MNERATRRKTRITVAALLSAAGLAMIAAGAGKIAGKEAKAEEIKIVDEAAKRVRSRCWKVRPCG